MNRFESFLAQQFEDYMTYRRQLGYDTENLRWALKTVDRYLISQNADACDLTAAFFLSLQADLRTQNKTINRVLSYTRGFFEYLLRKEYCQHNPLKGDPLAARRTIYSVYLFSTTNRCAAWRRLPQAA